MPNLTEVAQWEPAVYELATTDPLLGGAGGQLNIAAQQLANRTSFLQAAINALQGAGFTNTADITAAINAHLTAESHLTQAQVIALIAANSTAAPVQSVAGKTGAVTLTPADAGAEPANANIQAHIAAPHQPLLTNVDANARAFSKLAVDANSLTKTGYYTGNGANWPPNAINYYMQVIRHGNNQGVFVLQYATEIHTGNTYQRLNDNGTWQPWVETTANKMVGEVSAFAGLFPPTGWLECNGTAISRTIYADLFAICGITYGGGNGTTTFNIPDLRGEFIRGWDHGRGIDVARGHASFQADMLKSHNHALLNIPGINNIGSSGTRYYGAYTGITDGLGTIGNTGGVETRPRNIAMMYCIRY